MKPVKEILIGIQIVNVSILMWLTFLAVQGCHRKEYVPKDGGFINENLKPLSNAPSINGRKEKE